MEMMLSNSKLFGNWTPAIPLVIALCFSSCKQRDRGDVGTPSIRDDLMNAIQAEVRSTGQARNFDLNKYQVDTVSSPWIPQLVYYIASYDAPDISPHAAFRVVGAKHGNRWGLLSDSAAWSRLVGDWQPNSSESERGSCVEKAIYSRNNLARQRLPILYEDSTDLRRPFVYARKEKASLLRPAATSDHVFVFWLIESNTSIQYECKYPTVRPVKADSSVGQIDAGS